VVKNVTGKTQCYNLSIQLYDEGHKKTHLQPILSALLPNSDTPTYEKMWDAIGSMYLEHVGEVFNPPKIHCDNEKAFMNATKRKFPNTIILTCYFHISECIRKKGKIFFNFLNK